MPWFTDAGMLFYRKDLLEAAGKQPPETWQELAATAKELQDQARAGGNDRMWGFVYQGKAYEGLTCDALEWVDSFGGGQIVDAEGKITINNPKAADALTWAASTVGTIAPEGVLNYSEEEARGVFQSGNAIFMRNWPYAWALGQAADSPIKDKIGVSALPAGAQGERNTGTLGGWQLAVSSYSANPDVAVDLVRYLTSEAEQKRRAIEGLLQPDDREPLQGSGGADRGAVLRLALRGVRQRRGAARRGSPGSQVQPGQLRVLQRGPRGAEQAGRGTRQPRRAREEAGPAVARRALVGQHGARAGPPWQR